MTPFDTNLYRHLAGFFSEHGFELLPDKKQFRKTTPTGFQNVIFSPAHYGPTTLLDVNFGCRHEQIEQTTQQFLPTLTDFRPDANTLLTSIGKYNQQTPPRYSIDSEEQLATICGEIEHFFTETGFDFLDRKSVV